MSKSGSIDRGVYSKLEESLIGPAPDEVLPKSSATPMMEVVAPANMAEGFEFQVQVAGQIHMIKVPAGGVKEGQKFAVPMPSGDGLAVGQESKVSVPVGAWKDGVCNCLAHGPCHNHVCMGLFCPLVAVAQVITRLRLNHFGNEGTRAETTGAFQKILIAFLGYVVLFSILFVLPASDDYYENPAEAPAIDKVLDFLRKTVHMVYVIATMYLAWKVRCHMRSKYALPEQIPVPGAEDIFCSVVCLPLSIMQMMRHTADYSTYRSSCCTETGLPANVPELA